MTRPQLVIKNLFRNRRRTFLTTASVTAFVFLLSLLSATYRYLFSLNDRDFTYLILLVIPRVSSQIPLPISYRQQIAKLPGVDAVSPVVTFDGFYGDTWLVAWACDPEIVLKVFSEWQLSEDQKAAFRTEKVAVIAGKKMAEQHRWKLGDHIPIRSESYNVTLDLVLRGIYTSSTDESFLALHWDYLNDALGGNMGAAFWVLAHSPEDVPRLTKGIDDMFRNAQVETRTQTMKQFTLNFLAMLGNIKLILVGIGSAVVFAILLIVATTMGMSIRERTVEIAILRSLGFQARQIMGLLAAEGLAISLAGAAIGCLATAILCRWVRGYRVGGWVPFLIQVDVYTAALILCVVLLASLGSTLVPARRASRVNIAEALRFVG